MDETMAMVYVGDVYSLVAQEGTNETTDESKKSDDAKSSENDDLLPFIR